MKPIDGELKEQLARAKMAIRPEVRAAFVISEFGGHSDAAALAVQLEIGPAKQTIRGAAMSYYRTPEHRARQSAAIQQWRPWEHSTGPKSDDGKVQVSRNAYKGGTRARLRELGRLLREQGDALKRIG